MFRLLVVILLAAACPAGAQTNPPASPPPPVLVPAPTGPAIQVPQGPPDRSNFSDRIERCIHAGSAAGLGPNDNAQFSRRCAN